jgi:hypothetical protein
LLYEDINKRVCGKASLTSQQVHNSVMLQKIPPRTLFLDFDGVVHPTVATPKQLFAQAPMLVEAIVRWQPRVVISSSWRFHFSLEEILSRLPQAIAVQVQGKTGEAHIGKHARWHEIQTYCARHRIANWRALDDSAFEFPTDCQELIRCDGAIGLTALEVARLESWLSGVPS